MASNCNGKKWSAKVAGEQSIDLFLALYLGMNGSMTEEAVVISVMDYSLDVLVLSTGSNHRVYTNVRKNLNYSHFSKFTFEYIFNQFVFAEDGPQRGEN
jgi:exoribonuclease R